MMKETLKFLLSAFVLIAVLMFTAIILTGCTYI